MSRRPRILISAGEASGDRLGAGLAEALLRQRPDLELVGMGGERMRRAGVRIVQHSSEVAVVGIVEVLSHLPAIRRAMRRLEREIIERKPDLVLPVDFPDFNLRLAARARRAGVEVVYYVSPQVWAWRKGRVRVIARRVRRMLVLFPFEAEFYEHSGVPVSFVGHPLAEALAEPRPRETLCKLAGVDPARRTVALMPGSRRGELVRLLPPMLGAAKRLAARDPSLQWLIPLAPDLPVTPVEQAALRAGLDVRVRPGMFPEILSICDAGVVASGTASLEAALAGLPIVVVYRMSAVSHWIGRMLVHLDDIALPNLIAGRRVVPELVQADCNEQRIAAALGRYLDDPVESARVRGELGALRSRLGGSGAFDAAATEVLRELDSIRG